MRAGWWRVRLQPSKREKEAWGSQGLFLGGVGGCRRVREVAHPVTRSLAQVSPVCTRKYAESGTQ